MKTCVVAIGRRENLYAREFVEHYKNLGFDNVIILDNNYGDEEHFEEVLQDYVESGFVIIENYRDQVRAQMKAYTIEYNKYKNNYDWFLMVDFDEFLTLEKDKNVSEFLSRFPTDCEVIVANWAQYGDNGQIYADYSKPLLERFTEARPMAKSQYNFVDDMHIKSFVRGRLPNVVWYSNPHIPTNPLVCYNAKGERCESSPFQPVDHSVAYFKHFTTKSCEEYCNKLLRGTPDRTYDLFLRTYAKRYFLINDWTEEKEKFFKEHGYSGV